MSDAVVPLIEIRNATLYRGNTRVFENLNLCVRQHEPTAILGPNGSGKTTLLKVIYRELYPAHSGNSSVRILGRERWNVWELRARIGVVSHDLQMTYRPATTGLDVVLSGFHSSIGMHGQLSQRITATQSDRARDVMQQLGIGALAKTALARMSTGQQRRCLLARALVHDPDTLVLDEPTAGLDLAAGFDYLRRIRSLAKDGKNILLVTHLINEIPPEIERIILLREGQVVADGGKSQTLNASMLQQTYGTPVKITEIDGYYLATPIP